MSAAQKCQLTRLNEWNESAIDLANAKHCDTPHRATTHRNTLQHTATHCNTPQRDRSWNAFCTKERI